MSTYLVNGWYPIRLKINISNTHEVSAKLMRQTKHWKADQPTPARGRKGNKPLSPLQPSCIGDFALSPRINRFHSGQWSGLASGHLGLQWALAIKPLAATTETQKPLGALAEGVQWYRCGHTVPAGFAATGKAPCATSLPSRDGTMQDQNRHHSKSKQLVKFWLHHSHCFQVSSLNHC